MATAAICGMGGVVTGIASEITNWEISRTVDALDATSMASAGWKEKVACLKGATGSAKAFNKGSIGSASGSFKTASLGGNTISGSIIINRITCTTSVDGLVEFNHEFTFTGAINIA